MSDKTEDPTPRRLRKAREEGDSGASGYAAQAVAFVAAVALVPAAARALATRASIALTTAIAAAGAGPVRGRFDSVELAGMVLALVVPVVAAAGIAAGLTMLVQTGGVFASKRIALRLDRLDPIAGIRALFSAARLFAVARSLVAGVLVGWLAWAELRDHIADLVHIEGRPQWAGVVVGDAAGGVAWKVAWVGLALAFVDFLVTRRAWRARLRMTKGEIKREHKEAEGDPLVKAARERAYHELLAQAPVGNVRHASVVIVNPTHLACALRYSEDGGDEAPVVVASGEGELAARIVQAAREYGVPVVQDVPLARALIELQVGDVIPEALYEAVAEILREIWAGGDAPARE
jgi:type III secretion protein U